MSRESKENNARGGVRSGAGEREERLAAALRENLRKRKAQQRSRGESGPGKSAPSGSVDGGDRR